MDYPKLIVPNQKEESINIQRVKTALNVQNMLHVPLQFCTSFIFCTFPTIFNSKIQLSSEFQEVSQFKRIVSFVKLCIFKSHCTFICKGYISYITLIKELSGKERSELTT